MIHESLFTHALRSIFLWFYCLPILEAVIILILTTALFLFLHRRSKRHRLWKPFLCVCCMLWISAIAAMTLGTRAADASLTEIQLVPFHSYAAVLNGKSTEILRSNFMNVLLFYPAGVLLGDVFPQRWRLWQRMVLIAVLCAAISAGIEYCQYCYCLGTAEIDDVIHNTLGAALGVLVCKIQVNIFMK